MYNLQIIFREKVRMLLLNDLVNSDLLYPAMLFGCIRQNILTAFEKQLKWGIKACFKRTKYERSSDLEKCLNILLVGFLNGSQNLNFFLAMENGLVPRFTGKLEPPPA